MVNRKLKVGDPITQELIDAINEMAVDHWRLLEESLDNYEKQSKTDIKFECLADKLLKGETDGK